MIFHCSFQTLLRQDVSVVGTDKVLFLDDFVLPTPPPNTLEIRSLAKEGNVERVTCRDYEKVECCVSEPAPQQTFMWKHFSRISKSLDECVSTPNGAWHGPDDALLEANQSASDSLWTQKVMDALMKSVAANGQKIVIA